MSEDNKQPPLDPITKAHDDGWMEGRAQGKSRERTLEQENDLLRRQLAQAAPPSGLNAERYGWGGAEEACNHGRSAHTDTGCRDCLCKQTYDGPLALIKE